MPSCAFRKCRSHSRKNNKEQGITFHMFPKDELVKHKWVHVLRKQRHEPDWEATKNSRVCCMHFRDEDTYITDRGLKRLLKTAVPYFEQMKRVKTEPSVRCCSPNSLDNVNVSDEESIFESPRIAYLQGKYKKVVNDKKKLIQENNNIRRQNKRLRQRVEFLTESIIRIRKEMLDSHVTIEVDVLHEDRLQDSPYPGSPNPETPGSPAQGNHAQCDPGQSESSPERTLPDQNSASQDITKQNPSDENSQFQGGEP